MKKLLALSMTVMMLLAAGCQPAGNAQNGNAPGNTPMPVSLGEGSPTGEITVSAYDYMQYGQFLESAARKFEAQHEGTKINVNVFSSMPEIKTVQSDGGMSVAMIENTNNPDAINDYIRALNTELMSGGGADVLAMDVIPYYKYAEAGQLVDMSAFMEQDAAFNRADYYEGVLDAVRYKGGQYIMPVDMMYQYLTYNKELLSEAQIAEIQSKSGLTYADMLSIAGAQFAAKEDVSLLSENKEELLMNLIAMRGTEFLNLEDKTCNFTSGAFEQLLHDVAQYEKDGFLPPMIGLDMEEMLGGVITGGAMSIMMGGSTESYFASNSGRSLMNHFNTNADGRQMVMRIGGPSTENHEIAGLLLNDGGAAEVMFSGAYGINANTENPELAWEFIKFLMSEEIQLSMMMGGIPVHKAAAEESVKQQIANQMFMGTSVAMAVPAPSEEGGGNAAEDGETNASMPIGSLGEFREPAFVKAELTPEQTEVYDRYMAQFNAFVAKLTTHSVTDDNFNIIIGNETEKFFSGEASAEDVARALQSKIGLILSEQ